ncbi:hypothetical protein BH23CHL1_BH23CHL1_10600 [soil metagenome]
MTAAKRPPGYNGRPGAMARARLLTGSKRSVMATSIATATLVIGATASLAAGYFSHNVQQGDTLSDLAAQYGTSVDALIALNSIGNPDLIVVNDELLIRPVADGETVEGVTGHSIKQTHTVISGDTLTAIAESLGVTVEELAAANRMLNPDLIVTGDLLIVPSEPASAEALPEDSNPQTDVENTETAESTGNDEVAAPVLVTNDVRPQQPPASVQAGAATLHLVLPGETVESIAEAYGVTVPQLLAANGQAQNGVSSGMILKVPPADTAGVQLVNMPAAIEMSAVGSELTAVSVATAYWGASISENTLLASLGMSDNPHLGFRGDINGQFGGTDDYGVYAAPLSEAVSEHGFIGEVFYADGDATQLTDRIDRGLPVVTWITYQTAQAEPQRVDDDVRPFTVVAGKQAVVAYGYDDQGVLVVDLASGGYSHINWADFMRSWNYFDGMGLAISPI